MFNFEYKRVVLVDSADFCYAEIPLDQHAILVGKGNLGKSSILNSLRLFLLPENSFTKCKKKFAFKSKTGEYSKDQSYRHYFPSNSSFLILEVKNTSGYYCQILYKAKNYHYNRLFVPLAYNDIRDLFWHCCDDDDKDHIGRAIKGLTSISLIKKLKQKTAKIKIISNTEILKELLYANDLLDEEKTRYSLFPLIENKNSKIESLRTLFLLLFDMTANSNLMTTAVANIIEADKKYHNDRLDFNINDFLRHHEQLEEKAKYLTKIKNKENKFLQIKKKYKTYTQLSQADKDFINFFHSMEAEKKNIIEKKQKLSLDINPLQQQSQKFDSKIKVLKKNLTGKEAQIDQKKKELEKAEEDIKQGNQIIYEYNNLEIKEITSKLEEKIHQSKEQINALENEKKAEQRIITLKKLKKQYKREINQLIVSIENQEFMLSKQLSQKSFNVLAALNKKILTANPTKILDKETKENIENFTKLFDDDNNFYHFFDQKFEKRSGYFTEDLRRSLKDKNQSINEVKKELSLLNESNNSLYRQKILMNRSKDLIILKSNSNLLKNTPFQKQTDLHLPKI